MSRAAAGWLLAALAATALAPAAVASAAVAASAPAPAPTKAPPGKPAPAVTPVAPAPYDPTVEGAFARAAAARVEKRSDDALAELGGIETRVDASADARVEAAYQRGLVLEEIGRAAEAASVYEVILRDAPRGAPAGHVRLSLARRRARDGDLDAAVEHYRRLIGGPPALAAPALLEGGAVDERRGRLPAAIDAYRNLIASFPRSAEMPQAKAALASLCGRVVGAPSATNLADAFARAECHMEGGRPKEAERTYEAALKRTRDRDDRIELWMALGRCLVSQDRFAAAESAFRKIIRAQPGSAQAAQAQMEIVQGHLDRGRLPDAISELGRMAKAFKGTHQAAQALFMSGNCWEGLGNRKKAEEAYRKVLDTAPGSQWAGEAQRALLRIMEEAR